MYVGRVVMVHTHPDILITLCVVLLDGGIFFFYLDRWDTARWRKACLLHLIICESPTIITCAYDVGMVCLHVWMHPSVCPTLTSLFPT